MAEPLPMFPLGTVLVPGAFLPLHVFEPRYRELVKACLEGTPEFGVALIERGSEVGGGDHRFDVACVARIVEAVPFDDGRWALATVGDRRVRIERWLDDDPFPRAEVADWPDPPDERDREQVEDRALVSKLRRALALCAEVGQPSADATVELDDDPVAALWQVAALAPLGPLDRLSVLASPSAGHRAELLGRLLDDATTVLAARVAEG